MRFLFSENMKGDDLSLNLPIQTQPGMNKITNFDDKHNYVLSGYLKLTLI